MKVPYEFIYRNTVQAIGDFHSQFFVDVTGAGNIISVQFKAQDVTDFVDDWYFGLRVNGVDVLTGADRPHITALNLEPLIEGLSIPVDYLDRLSPTVDTRNKGQINAPIVVIVTVDDGVSVGDVGGEIHAAGTQNPPGDADEFGFWNSVSGLLKKATWAQLKTALTTLFDARYATPTDVSAAVAGLSWKTKVRAATTANISLAAPGATHDGVTLSNGDRFLVWFQSTQTQNGIYIYNGASSTATRPTDADSGTELVNASCYVSEGTLYHDKQFTCITDAPITIGATNIVFDIFSSGSGSGGGSSNGSITFDDGDASTTDGTFIFDDGRA